MKKEFFQNNRENLMKKVKDNSLVIMFSGSAPKKTADEYYEYSPNRNFFYLTGIERENIILVMNKKDDSVKTTLFIEENDPIMAKWIGEKMPKEEAEKISGITNIDYIDNLKRFINSRISFGDIKNIYMDFERDNWEDTPSVSLQVSKEIKERYPYVEFHNIYSEICNLRMVKTEEEIENIKKAAEITKEGVELLMKNATPGMMEYELEAYFDFALRRRGIKEKSFKTIAASGKNATILHYSSNNSKSSDGDLILFDLGAVYNNYSADVSRTFPLNGKFTPRQKEVYNVVLKAMDEVQKAAKPGMTLGKLNDIAKKYLAEGCIKLGLIKEEKELRKYYFHSVAHSLGLDTHDVGMTSETVLVPGMVFTNEPGLYIEEEGIGIRIEDDLLITDTGCEVINKDIIKTVEEIEAFMAK